ncbi:MAG: hypothetical protein ACTSW4_08155 [Candidatus Ranarchaeia archaeon]
MTANHNFKQSHLPLNTEEGSPGSSSKEEEKACPDYFEEKDPKEERQIRKARINAFFFGLVFVVIGLTLVFFGYTMWTGGDSSVSWLSNALFLGGLVTLFFGGGTLISALSPPKEPEPIKIITELRCRNCDYKATRDFKRGDYIFLETGTCIKCQSPTYIWGIYSNPPLTEAEKKILAEDL